MNSPFRRFARFKHPAAVLAILAGLLALGFLAYSEFIVNIQSAEFVPVSLNSQKSARYQADLTVVPLPQVLVDIVANVIQDQEPNADVETRFGIVRANLLTPVAWLVAPTATPTPILTPRPTTTPLPTFTPRPTTTPLPTFTPTPADPWVALGDWRIACTTEIDLAPVTANKIKFQMISGGNEDNRVSFYCCGSSGASFLANGTWQSTIDKPIALRSGDWHETADLKGAVVTRAQFSVGCNDNESALVRIYYLPVGASTLTPTPGPLATTPLRPSPTITSTGSPTATPIRTATPSPTATSTQTPTSSPTATRTPTAKPTNPATLFPTSTRAISTSAAAITATPTKPPAPYNSIVFHQIENGIDVLKVIDLNRNTVTPFVNIGPVMDLTMGTNALPGAWSPENLMFAYISTVSKGGTSILNVFDLKTNTARALFSSDTGGGLSSPTWSPDGKQIAVIRTTVNRATWAIDILNADGSRCSAKVECEIRLSTGHEQFQRGLAWSKQGLLAVGMNTINPSEIYTMFTDGGLGTNLTNHPADDGTPALSPDGRQIAFTSTRDGFNQIYVMNADGTGVRRLSQGNSADWSPSWSPDGNWIAFTSDRDSPADIYVMDLLGGNITRLTQTGGDHPIWSR